MTDFVLSCLELVFFPINSTNMLILVPFYLMVISFIVGLVYRLMHIGTR